MRSVVLIQGLLRGMGREALCELLAMKESQPETGANLYTRCSVIDAPWDLPDGDYTVTFFDCIVSARREGGLWVPGGTAVHIPPHPGRSAVDRPQQFQESPRILPALRNRVA